MMPDEDRHVPTIKKRGRSRKLWIHNSFDEEGGCIYCHRLVTSPNISVKKVRCRAGRRRQTAATAFLLTFQHRAHTSESPRRISSTRSCLNTWYLAACTCSALPCCLPCPAQLMNPAAHLCMEKRLLCPAPPRPTKPNPPPSPCMQKHRINPAACSYPALPCPT